MNRDLLLFHLKEAKEELDQTIAQIEIEPDYDAAELRIAMSHLYHHLNTAWNGKDISRERHKTCSRSDFHTLRKFPQNEDLLLF